MTSHIKYSIKKEFKSIKNCISSFIQIWLLDYLYAHAATKHGLEKCFHRKKDPHPSTE